MRIYFIFVFIFLYSSTMAQGIFEGEFYNPTKKLGIGVIKVNTIISKTKCTFFQNEMYIFL